ncbi:6,7-dimethyl-8-ribityllumazine synthase [Candidatus Woesearchaeota archaeon]|nr:6,7-dimethyl-8-ribityllumazine synthase [Candidatus Woesearchaeota archaeon]
MVKIGIVVANFYKKYADTMLKKAKEAAKKLGADTEVIEVPGSFELPIAALKLLKRNNIHGVVALGVVMQGETDHDIIVAESAARKLMDLSIEFNKPIGLGIIGPRVNEKQAEARLEEYAERSVKAAIEMIKKLS